MSVHTLNQHNNGLVSSPTSRLSTRTTIAHCTRPFALLLIIHSRKALRDGRVPHVYVSNPIDLSMKTDSIKKLDVI